MVQMIMLTPATALVLALSGLLILLVALYAAWDVAYEAGRRAGRKEGAR